MVAGGFGGALLGSLLSDKVGLSPVANMVGFSAGGLALGWAASLLIDVFTASSEEGHE